MAQWRRSPTPSARWREISSRKDWISRCISARIDCRAVPPPPPQPLPLRPALPAAGALCLVGIGGELRRPSGVAGQERAADGHAAAHVAVGGAVREGMFWAAAGSPLTLCGAPKGAAQAAAASHAQGVGRGMLTGPGLEIWPSQRQVDGWNRLAVGLSEGGGGERSRGWPGAPGASDGPSHARLRRWVGGSPGGPRRHSGMLGNQRGANALQASAGRDGSSRGHGRGRIQTRALAGTALVEWRERAFTRHGRDLAAGRPAPHGDAAAPAAIPLVSAPVSSDLARAAARISALRAASGLKGPPAPVSAATCPPAAAAKAWHRARDAASASAPVPACETGAVGAAVAAALSMAKPTARPPSPAANLPADALAQAASPHLPPRPATAAALARSAGFVRRSAGRRDPSRASWRPETLAASSSPAGAAAAARAGYAGLAQPLRRRQTAAAAWRAHAPRSPGPRYPTCGRTAGPRTARVRSRAACQPLTGPAGCRRSRHSAAGRAQSRQSSQCRRRM
eukprot:scaffold14246_cov105-Isochrysis_galbana.AAC.11